MSQTSYSTEQAKGFAGMKADLGPDYVRSMKAEGVVYIGRGAIQGTEDDQCKLPGTAGDGAKFVGVVLHSHAMESSESGDPQLADKDLASVMNKGVVLVKVEEAVVAGDAAYMRVAAGGNGVGSFGKSTGTSEREAVAGAKFLTSADANGLAELQLA